MNDHDAIPAELKALRNWVCYRLEVREGTPKPTKVPYSPSGSKARANDPSTWSTFEVCVAAASTRDFDGIGFEFTPPYVGVDLDECRSRVTGQVEDWAQRIIDQLKGYAEVSQSGTGIHIIVKGDLPPGGRKRGGIEVYSEGRYFTMSGEHVEGTPLSVEPRTAEMAAFHSEHFPPAPPAPERPVPSAPSNLADEDVLSRASTAANGWRFNALWHGEWEHLGYNSQSEADLALCAILAFWCGRDTSRIDSLFRQSGLMREKWNRADYRSKTLALAIAGAGETYSGGSNNTQEESTPQAKPRHRFESLPWPGSTGTGAVEWDVDNLLPRASVCLLTGEPGCGKSTFATALGYAVAQGESFLGRSVSKRPVLILDAEDPEAAIIDRFERLRIEEGNGLHIFGHWCGEEPPSAGGAEVIEWVAQCDPRPIIIVDSLIRFHPGSENDASETQKYMGQYRRLAGAGASVILIHHSGKAETAKDYRGSSDIKGSVDVAYKLTMVGDGSQLDLLELRAFKQRISVSPRVLVRYKDGKFTEGDAQDETMRTVHEQLIELLKTHPGITSTRFYAIATEAGLGRNRSREFLTAGLANGTVDRIPDGHRQRYFWRADMQSPLQWC